MMIKLDMTEYKKPKTQEDYDKIARLYALAEKLHVKIGGKHESVYTVRNR